MFCFQGEVIVKQLDLADLASVQRLVGELLQEPRLDMLILNAGIMGGPLTYTSAGFELQMGTNHIGAAPCMDLPYLAIPCYLNKD